MTDLDRFVELKTTKAHLERELRQIKDEIAPVEQRLLEQFAREGVSGKRHAASGRLVSITRQIWARAAGSDKQHVAEAMRTIPELSAFVELGFNTHSVSGYFREQARAYAENGNPVDLDNLVPSPLRGLIQLTEDHQLSVRG